MSSWIAAGLDEARFWHATPRYIKLCIDAAVKRLQRESDLLDAQAWNVGRLVLRAYHNPTKYPSYREAFPPRSAGPKRPKTGREIMSSLMQLNAALGGKVIRK
ncbi:hypothetical protein [Pseudooceanicola sp. MF1-13]|uniref:hypothetical protein n=1 Tax=Pseudooceanicola sp. MF1-13 TaxID=3379095 RepID=UPI0038924260